MMDYRTGRTAAMLCRVAAAAVVSLLFCAHARADDHAGCATAFPAGKTVTLTGKTTPGERNKETDRVMLRLTAGPSSATGVPFVTGTIAASQLKDGKVAWNAGPPSRWGNTCMDVVAPDGRRWSFLALTWEDDNAHPNLHAVIDWSAGGHAIVGFMDTKSGAYHEAQVVLVGFTGAEQHLLQGPATAESAPDGRLCEALFRHDKGHFFVGTGYATAPDTSPGHLALQLDPEPGANSPHALNGRFIVTEGPKRLLPHHFDSTHSACIDLPDPRYALLPLSAGGGVQMILWLWGEDGVPQKNDRLMGYVTFPGSTIMRSKVALWRL